MVVPFIDLDPQFKAVEPAILKAVQKVVRSRQFILGPFVEEFEKAVALRTGAKYAFGVASGSDALYLSLLACGIGAGDEVITTPFTFFATAGMISRAGATPVFSDINEDTFNLDPQKIERAITKKTKAIIPVSLYGLSADMDPILKIARRHGLYVIEDAAQSFGARYKSAASGTTADAGCFSFYPSKNFGGCGDGGMILTSVDKIGEQIKLLRDYGSKKRYYHEIVGVNSRLDALQAAILSVKLKWIDRWNRQRQAAAAIYDRELAGLALELPKSPKGFEHTYHLYTLKTPDRDALAVFLKERGIGTGIYYPVPLHLQQCYKNLGYRRGDLPVAEKVSGEILSLPMYAGLPVDHQRRTIASIHDYYRGGK